MSERKSTTLNLKDFVKVVNEVKSKLEEKGVNFSENVNNLLNQLLTLELQDLIEAKIEELKAKYRSRINNVNNLSSETAVPIIPINEKIIELIKNADLDTLIKLKLLFSPVSPSGDSLALLMLLPFLTSNKGGDGGNVSIKDLLAIVEKAYEKTPYQELLKVYEKVLENHPAIQQLRQEVQELKQKVASSDPLTFVQSIKQIAKELGLSERPNYDVELEKMKLELEKWKLEQEMRFKEIELMEKLKRRDKLEAMKMREQILKYLVAPFIKMLMPKLMKLGAGKGPSLEQLMKLPVKEITCPRCGNKFIIKALPDGKFPNEVKCPYCGLKLVKKSVVNNTPSGESKEEKPVSETSEGKEHESGETIPTGGFFGEEKKE